jgi:hypothetical protein
MTESHPDLADLVARIASFNDVWHALRDLCPDEDADEPSLAGLRDLKSVLQARLLRDPRRVAFLIRDEDPRLVESCYTVALYEPLAGRRDACHLPERVARRVLTEREISALLVER